MMRRACLLLAGLLATGACGTTVPQGAAPATPSVTAGQTATRSPSPSPAYRFIPVYERATAGSLLMVQKLMRDRQLVQHWAETANDGFIPPVNVRVIAEQCGTADAFYDPHEKSITICYELGAFLRELFAKPAPGQTAGPTPKELDESTVGALNGIFYHELGHALIDLYDLPTTGKEEDAVDQLSALVLITGAEEQRDYTGIMSTIEAWGRMSQEAESQPLDKEAFADEHSLSGQRYYNMMCYLYGSNHNAFLPLVANRELPVERAAQCEKEYAKMARSWATLLGPHLRVVLPSPSPMASTPSPTRTARPSG